MKKYLGLLIVLGLVFVTSVRAEEDDAVFCTMEAKQCPDGSYVGRGGPNCEFAPCGGTPPAEPTDRKTCTEEAKLCPDGSYVVRSGLRCEFAPCGISAENRVEGRIESYRVNMEKRREELKNKMEANRAVFMQEVAEKKEGFKSASPATKVGFCRAAENMLGQKFDSAIKTLENFQTRLSVVIEKLKTDGKDAPLAEEALNLSKVNLAEAKEKLTELRTLVPESCEGVTADTFEKVKLLSREIKDQLKEVKTDLQETISAIKDLRTTSSETDDSDDDKEENEN